VSYLLAASLRCQASSVAGVTGKTSVRCRRGSSRASAANHTRSAGEGTGQPRNRLFERHRIASASIPARVLAAGAGDVRSVPGTGELHASLDDVL